MLAFAEDGEARLLEHPSDEHPSSFVDERQAFERSVARKVVAQPLVVRAAQKARRDDRSDETARSDALDRRVKEESVPIRVTVQALLPARALSRRETHATVRRVHHDHTRSICDGCEAVGDAEELRKRAAPILRNATPERKQLRGQNGVAEPDSDLVSIGAHDALGDRRQCRGRIGRPVDEFAERREKQGAGPTSWIDYESRFVAGVPHLVPEQTR
jgi:hypothetical protein